ncbi:MAG: lysophospholipid acyltransferase family protein [Pyrinomonadaceae bacterium]
MPLTTDHFYEFAPLGQYSLKQRLSIRLADLAFFAAIKLVGLTVRFKVEGIEHLDAIRSSGKVPIYTFWHDRIFLSTYFFRNRGIVVMTSRSFDGEYIARFIQRFGYGSIRGSSSRGGSRALVQMIKAQRGGLPMGFSVDGPRGPKYVAQPGPVMLAKKTGNPMLPFIAEPKSFWSAKSWDQLHIPKPFTTATIHIGPPIYVSADADDVTARAKLFELQTSLDALVERGRTNR